MVNDIEITDDWPRGVFRGQYYAVNPELTSLVIIDEDTKIKGGPFDLKFWLEDQGFFPIDNKEETWLHHGGSFVWTKNPKSLGLDYTLPGIYKYKSKTETNTVSGEISSINKINPKYLGIAAGSVFLVGGLLYILNKTNGRKHIVSGYPPQYYTPVNQNIESKKTEIILDSVINCLYDLSKTNPKLLSNLKDDIKEFSNILLQTLNNKSEKDLNFLASLDRILFYTPVQNTLKSINPNISTTDIYAEMLDITKVSTPNVLERFQRLLEINEALNNSNNIDKTLKDMFFDILEYNFTTLLNYLKTAILNLPLYKFIEYQLSVIKHAILDGNANLILESFTVIFKNLELPIPNIDNIVQDIKSNILSTEIKSRYDIIINNLTICQIELFKKFQDLNNLSFSYGNNVITKNVFLPKF